MTSTNPEIGKSVVAAGIATNYHDVGAGRPVLMIHGSGPGVTGWANWRMNIGALAEQARVLVPDMVGFGYTDVPPNIRYDLEMWMTHLVGFLDAMEIERADVIGNSFGGGLALAMAIHHPERIRRLVLMGSVGVPFELTPGLDAVWGYTPSVENMRKLLEVFAYNTQLMSDDLVELRYRASMRPGVQEAFGAMFSPGPRQQYIDALASDEADIRRIPHETLVVHGREDLVIPLSNALTLAQWLPASQLHVFSRCGHWTQIEHAAEFNRLVAGFLAQD